MINWRKGLGGFAGGYRTAIKGVLEFAHSITTEPIINTPDCFTTMDSPIDPDGVSVDSAITPYLVKSSTIDSNGATLNSKITGSIGLNSLLCDC